MIVLYTDRCRDAKQISKVESKWKKCDAKRQIEE